MAHTTRQGSGHAESGTVESVDAGVGFANSDSGKVHVRIVHGKRPKRSRSSPFMSQRTTSFTIPASKAKHYPVGQKVRVCLYCMDESEGDSDDYDIMGGKSV